jgi:hypothetical protein
MIHLIPYLYIRKGNCDSSIAITLIYKGVGLPVRHPRTDRGIDPILTRFVRHRCVIHAHMAFRNLFRIRHPNKNGKARP